MFGASNQNNNSANDKNVNTRLKTFYGEISALQLSYWNGNLSVKINPLLSISAEGLRQYDYKRKAQTAIVPEKASALAREIERRILPEIEKVKNGEALEKPVSVGMSVGQKGNSAICFEYQKLDMDEVPTMYVSIYTEIGEDGKTTPENIYRYKCSKVTIVEDYDAATGNGHDVVTESEFLFIYDKIKTLPEATGTSAHASSQDKAGKSQYYQNANSNGNYQSSTNNASDAVPQQVYDLPFGLDSGTTSLPFN